MQRMGDTSLDRMLCRRQCLAENLPTEHLRTANVATISTEDVVLDALEIEQGNQVVENRVHGVLANATAVYKQAGTANECRIITGQE